MWKPVAVLMLLAEPIPASAVPAIVPTTAAISAYGVGQSYVRLFQDSVMPGTCGIVLERARCNADFHAVQQWRGNDPTDASFAKWLEDGDISSHPKDWNGSYIPEKGWAEDPTFAWWYTAGAVSVAIDQPRDEATSEYLAHYVDELARHVGAIPEGLQGVIPSSGTPFERALPLQHALDAAIPPTPYPAPSFATGLTGTAQLGAYVSTLQELVDNPLALSRPESRAFAAVVLAELERRHRQLSDGLSVAGVQAAVNAEIPSDPERLDALWRQPLSAQIVNMKWPDGPRNALLLGAAVAQVAYNAAVLKDSSADSSFRSVLARLPPWPGTTERVRSDIAALRHVPYAARGGSWEDINKAAARATLDLINNR
jgi:hypothetical protein